MICRRSELRYGLGIVIHVQTEVHILHSEPLDFKNERLSLRFIFLGLVALEIIEDKRKIEFAVLFCENVSYILQIDIRHHKFLWRRKGTKTHADVIRIDNDISLSVFQINIFQGNGKQRTYLQSPYRQLRFPFLGKIFSHLGSSKRLNQSTVQQSHKNINKQEKIPYQPERKFQAQR